MCVKCRDLQVGMRITNRVTRSNVIVAEKGEVLSEVLIRLLLFLGVKRVLVEDATLEPAVTVPLVTAR